MPTAYVEPLRASYKNMKAALFQPFNLDKWIALGFASWIAGWATGSAYNFNVPGKLFSRGATLGESAASVGREFAGYWADPIIQFWIVVGVILLVVVAIVIAWIQSRGEFVFLDAVLNGRRAIAAPWREWAKEGNSLFVWKLVYALVVLVAFATLCAASFFLATGGHIPGSLSEVPWMWLGLGIGVVWLPVTIAGAYVNLFLRHFIAPIMYRDRVTTNQAWATFLPILNARLGTFVAYGLFLLVVYIGLFIALIPAIILTCCMLGCLLMIPVVGSIVWLPVSYSLRAFGPEFLAQFGPEWSVWPPVPEPAGAPPESPD